MAAASRLDTVAAVGPRDEDAASRAVSGRKRFSLVSTALPKTTLLPPMAQLGDGFTLFTNRSRLHLKQTTIR